ncbi:unnamed protein product, partial [Urochloa humidicola]
LSAVISLSLLLPPPVKGNAVLSRVPSPARFVELRPSPSNRRRPRLLHLPLDLSIASLPRLSHYLAGD